MNKTRKNKKCKYNKTAKLQNENCSPTSKHKYKSMKRIKELIPKIKEVSIDKNDQILIIIKTHL